MSPRTRHTITYTTAGAALLTVAVLIAVQLHSHGVPAALLFVCAIGVPLAAWHEASGLVHRIAHPHRDDEEPDERFGLAS
ncbi:hypothetical protein [Streptomyces bohaiensis]|uniref:DUF2933 domain-containing protein n=2 Tax=Streptomyces bohaiensis TaxID=1431344 RepID=A0ABX1C851_9ACTN|nr:hypothetical protein [Streptomyces bohaiensis]NJQ13512.1 hypothetical protein [Streptomyces bohaiensis]